MANIFLSTPFLLLTAFATVSASVFADIGHTSWVWFQRSGAILVLVGAVLSYRSVVRLGKAGVGGAPVTFSIGKIVSTDDSEGRQTLRVSYDKDTEDRFSQHDLDKTAGYFGAWMAISGTLIWGYGDLLGLML